LQLSSAGSVHDELFILFDAAKLCEDMVMLGRGASFCGFRGDLCLFRVLEIQGSPAQALKKFTFNNAYST
jgi:hypothetical protein